MPTKRRKLTPRTIGISSAAIAAWREGGFHTLNRELGIGPHQHSPFDATRATPPPWIQDNWNTDLRGGLSGVAGWRHAWGLRQRLIELAGPPGRVGRHGEPLGPGRRGRPPARV
jgi:hypothetical protein